MEPLAQWIRVAKKPQVHGGVLTAPRMQADPRYRDAADPQTSGRSGPPGVHPSGVGEPADPAVPQAHESQEPQPPSLGHW